MANNNRVRTLIVEDAPFVRKTIANLLSEDEHIEVVGTVGDGMAALEAIEHLKPDVITMDVDMPVMDGITAIKHIMVRQPRPVVMLSGLSKYGSVTLEALRLGAVDFFPKPEGSNLSQIKEQIHRLHKKIRQAVFVNTEAIKRVRLWRHIDTSRQDIDGLPLVVLIGAHLGASGNLLRLLAQVGAELPLAIVVLQDLTPQVLGPYVRELAAVVPWKIHVGTTCLIEPGNCYIATYDLAWRLEQTGSSLGPKLVPLPRKSSLTPANDLIAQAANMFGNNVAVVLLSGTTKDGVEGLVEAEKSGARILVLDPKECVFPYTPEYALDHLGVEPVSEHEIWRELQLMATASFRKD